MTRFPPGEPLEGVFVAAMTRGAVPRTMTERLFRLRCRRCARLGRQCQHRIGGWRIGWFRCWSRSGGWRNGRFRRWSQSGGWRNGRFRRWSQSRGWRRSRRGGLCRARSSEKSNDGQQADEKERHPRITGADDAIRTSIQNTIPPVNRRSASGVGRSDSGGREPIQRIVVGRLQRPTAGGPVRSLVPASHNQTTNRLPPTAPPIPPLTPEPHSRVTAIARKRSEDPCRSHSADRPPHGPYRTMSLHRIPHVGCEHFRHGSTEQSS